MKTIVWDIDDVLNDLTRAWLEKAWLPAHPDCGLRYENITENPPRYLPGIEKDEYFASLDAFRLSVQAEEIIPDARVLEWFDRHGLGFRHIALTARPRGTVLPAIGWVLRHFGRWFETFSYVPAVRPADPPGHPDTQKHEFLAWLGKADYFIDDNTGNVEQVRKLGVQSFLVKQPWNTSKQTLIDILNGLDL